MSNKNNRHPKVEDPDEPDRASRAHLRQFCPEVNMPVFDVSVDPGTSQAMVPDAYQLAQIAIEIGETLGIPPHRILSPEQSVTRDALKLVLNPRHQI